MKRDIESYIILQHYIRVTEFLGRVLGPDYEIALHDLAVPGGAIIAIANNHISGRRIGGFLSQTVAQMVHDKTYGNREYRIHYRWMTQEGKVIQSSAMFIKDVRQNLIGILSVNFDDSRYKELSAKLMGLCHPDAFMESSFMFDEEMNRLPEGPVFSYAESFWGASDGATQEVVRQAMKDLNILPEHLGTEEKIAVINYLDAQGVFMVKGAVKDVADFLDSSTASVYRYLSEARKGRKPDGKEDE